MEIIIGGVFILIVAGLLILRKKPTSTTEAPYKVETVSSDNGIKFVAPEPVVETPAPVVEATPVVEEAPAKKTRAPRAPKAEKAPKAAKPKAPAKKTTTTRSKKV